MKNDISTPEDIRRLVDGFYEKVRADGVIGFIFNDIVKVDWPKHLPRMYDFWEFLLLGHDTYRGNPIEKHFEVARLVALEPAHFDRWVVLFQQTVDEFFAGPKADDAKFRAYGIAETWKYKFAGGHGIGIVGR